MKWPEINEAAMAKEKLQSWSSGPFDCFEDMNICCWTCGPAKNMAFASVFRGFHCKESYEKTKKEADFRVNFDENPMVLKGVLFKTR